MTVAGLENRGMPELSTFPVGALKMGWWTGCRGSEEELLFLNQKTENTFLVPSLLYRFREETEILQLSGKAVQSAAKVRSSESDC